MQSCTAITANRLKNKDFTIISNNCGAGIFGYKELGLQYTTPTVGLFFFLEDYIKFLSNLEHYLNILIQFVGVSKHPTVKEHMSLRGHPYPVGVLEDVEICFLHYHSEEEARVKWTRRARRVNLENLFVMLVGDEKGNANPDPHVWDSHRIEDFKRLPLKNKVIMPDPTNPHKDVTVFSGKSQVEVEHFCMVKWLNGEYCGGGS